MECHKGSFLGSIRTLARGDEVILNVWEIRGFRSKREFDSGHNGDPKFGVGK